MAGNSKPVHQETSNLVKIWILMSTLTGKNLVSISLTILEKFKIEDFVFSIPHLVGKISSIFYLLGEEIKRQNLQFWISQEWFEVSVPNFYQLLTFIGTRFVQILMGLGASDLDFLPKTSKTSNWRGRSKFWATLFKFGENSFLS